MSDNITLPREAVEKIHEAWSSEVYPPATSIEWYDIMDALRAALAAPRPEPVRHPGYVIGNHWLETAYERLFAGESEDAILEDYELVREPRLRDLRRDAERYRRLLKWLIVTGLLSRERCRIDSPASYGDWWILRKPKVIEAGFVGYGETEDAAIDAAMDASTAPASAAVEPAIRARGEVPR